MRKNLLVISIMVLFLMSCTKSSEKISPYLDLEEGFTQTLVFETKTNASKMGSFEEANEIQFRLDSITTDNSYVFTGKVVRIRYSSNMLGKKEGFDTEVVKSLNNNSKMSIEELNLYNQVKQYLNEEFTMILDKRGNILQEASFRTGVYSSDVITKGYSMAPVIFPDDELAIGYTWEHNTTNPLMKSQKIQFNYTVADITADRIILDVNMHIEGYGGLMKANNAKGTYEIDRKTKRFITGQREMNLQTGGGKAIYKVYEK